MKKKIYWIIFLAAASIGMRIFFYTHAPAYWRTGDSVGYYLTGKHIAETGIIFDHWRTPVYPFIMIAPYIFTGTALPENMPDGHVPQFITIRIMQSAAGVATVVLVFFLLTAIGVRSRWAAIYCLFVACNWTLIGFEANLLTEAFSTLWLTAVVYITIRLFKRYTPGMVIVLTVLFVFGVFLRPSFILIPIVILGLLVWYHRKKVVIATSVFSLMVYSGVLLFYIQGNMTYFGYPGVSRISDVNILGKILTQKLPIDKTADAGGIKEIVGTYIREYRYIPEPWQIYLRNTKLYDVSMASPMHTFVTGVLKDNFMMYLLRSTYEVPGALVDVSEFTDGLRPDSQTEAFFAVLKRIYRYGQYINLIVILAIPVTLFDALKKKTFGAAVQALLAIIVMYHIAFGVYLGYGDYGRHLSVMQPIIYLFSLFFWYRIYKQLFLWLHTR